MRLLSICTLATISTFAACGGQAPGSPLPDPMAEDTTFHPPALKEGMTRIELPPIPNIQPGQEAMWCQWVRAPLDRDIDVLEATGAQGVGGHHAILYATTSNAPIGTTRECTDEDLTTVRYLGAIGGEGATTDNAALPEGLVYRIPAGLALMANVHYVNYTQQPITGEGVLDIRFAEKDPTKRVATLFTNIDVEVDLAPKARASLDVNCTLQQDFQMFWFGNHMHSYGASAFTEVIRADGTQVMLRKDDRWEAEAKFNPSFTRWPVDSPLILRRGDRMHTHCEWNNTADHNVSFPSEMCVGFGFHIGDGVQIDCIKGEWTH